MKASNKTNIKPYMRKFYKGNLCYLILAVISTIFSVASSLMIAWLLQEIIDMVSGVDIGFSVLEVAGLVGSCLVLILISAAFRYFSQPRFVSKASRQYKNYVFSKLTQKGISSFSKENTSVYLSALSNDVTSIEQGYLSNIFGILYNIVVFFGALIMMLCYNPFLTLISVIVAALPFAVSMLSGSFLARTEKNVSDKNQSYMAMLSDCLGGFNVIKAFRAENKIHNYFNNESKKLSDAHESRKKTQVVINAFSDIASFMLQFGVLLVGTYLVVSGSSVSAGTVLVFVQLLNHIINPIGAIPQALAECRASKALIAKVADLLETNVRKEGNTEKSTLERGIELKNLSFAYDSEKPILKNINFTFDAEKSYCIVGASGSGKSTLLNTLIASHGSYGGAILYDDTELKEIKSESLYEMISVIQQNVFIFNASIRDNITMFSDFPREEVDRAIELSGLTELIAERGEHYLCGEGGCGLSGGEKQRISIARSLIKRSGVLLVDEATAALDAKTSTQVSSAILELEGITKIVITHSLDASILKRFDCILTLSGGEISESGTFSELLGKKGYFYSLFTVSQGEKRAIQ